MDAKSQVLGHDAVLHSRNANLLQFPMLKPSQVMPGILCKALQFGVVVQCGAMHEATCPGEDGRNRIRAGLLALLVLPKMTRHRAMSSSASERGEKESNHAAYSVSTVFPSAQTS